MIHCQITPTIVVQYQPPSTFTWRGHRIQDF